MNDKSQMLSIRLLEQLPVKEFISYRDKYGRILFDELERYGSRLISLKNKIKEKF